MGYYAKKKISLSRYIKKFKKKYITSYYKLQIIYFLFTFMSSKIFNL